MGDHQNLISNGREMITMNLGIRAHDINSFNPEEIAQIIADKGLSAVQLALKKSFPNFNIENGSLSPGLANYIGKEFQKRNIQIAVLGCYINIIHPNLSQRKKLLDYFKEHIRYARDFGCSIVGTETGNVHEKMGYTVDNFQEKPFLEVIDSVKELVNEAEKFGVIVGIEAGINHPVYTPKLMKRLLEAVDSNNLQVIFDPVNFLTEETYLNQEKIFQDAIDLFGDRICIVHCKDFEIVDGKLQVVPVGRGRLNYDFLMKLIKSKKPYINFLMEDTKEPFIDDSITYLKSKFKNA